MQKKYRKIKLETKENGYLQGVSGKGVERREELGIRYKDEKEATVL